MSQNSEHEHAVNEDRPDDSGVLEALGKAQQFLREAEAHILLRQYKRVDSVDYEHLTEEARVCMMLVRTAIGEALSIEEGSE
jgi:hypothetical protein